jgi:hypothetical protein
MAGKFRQIDKDARLLPDGSAAEQEVQAGAYDTAADHDLSYEDALLDRQLRIFLKSEYGSAQPPSGIFLRVLRALDENFRAATRPRLTAREAFNMMLSRLYQRLLGPTMGRLVPGAVALALVIVMINANTNQFLQVGPSTATLYSEVTTEMATGMETFDHADVEFATNRDERYVLRPVQRHQDAEFLDPVEYRTIRAHGTKPADIESETLLYDGTKLIVH